MQLFILAILALLVLPVRQFVRLGQNRMYKCSVGRISKYFVRSKKIKHEALGCRVGKKSAVNFICRSKVSIIVCQFNGCCVGVYACL